MKEIYKGDWFLPNSTVNIPGKLSICDNDNEITLTLYSKTYLNGDDIEMLSQGINKNVHEIILGDTGQKFSLYQCRISKCGSIGKSLYELSYKINFVFINVHLSQISDLLITKAEVKFPFLSSFFDGWNSLKDDDATAEKTSYSEPIVISEILNIILIDKYQKRIKNFDGSFELQYSKSLQLSYNVEQNFDQVLRNLSTFSSLLSFVTKKSINYQLETLRISLKNINCYDHHYNVKDNLYPVYIINFSLNSSYKKYNDDLHQNYMMFSKWQFSDYELNRFIKKWYQNSNLVTVYDFYNDTNNWFEGKSITLSNVMYNNKFLNLAQALESYYDNCDVTFAITNEEFTQKRQKILNSISDVALKKWASNNLRFPKSANFADKLEFLLGKFNDVLESKIAIKQFSENYPIRAKEYRNTLSHGRIDKIYQGKDFEKIYAFSKILMCFCILESLEMNNTDIINMCDANTYIYRQFQVITSIQ